MKRNKLLKCSITGLHNRGERGYILITLMLFVALLTIAALAILPEVKQQIKRDREEELMHRGTAYMRAIQHFYKKTGRYPARIEDLENTNNIRFLRKRYKDPLSSDPKTGKEKDFKFLHVGDKELSVLSGLGMAGGLGGQMAGQIPGLGPGQAQLLQQNLGQLGGTGIQTAFNRQPGGLSQPGGVAQSGGDANATNPAATDQSDANESNPSNQVAAGATASGPLQANSANGNNPLVFGGGPILGVTSSNKDKSIREFGDKIKHYNEWLFVYDPTGDRGGLLKGPVVPNSLKGGMGTPVGAVATQSQGGASGNQNPQPQKQGPINPEPMPPEE